MARVSWDGSRTRWSKAASVLRKHLQRWPNIETLDAGIRSLK